MIKTPLSTVIGGAGIWTPGATILGSASKTLNQIIKSLFSNNEVGFAYDPNDLTTLYQDAAGTIPVTSAGQPVGLILDKSGRGNHARQTTSASRPILQRDVITGTYYLAFDGTDDFLVTNNIDFTSTDKVSLFAGVRKLSDATQAVLVELSSSWSVNAGAFAILAPSYSGGAGYTSAARLSVVDTANQQAIIGTDYAAPISNVITSLYASDTRLWIDGQLKRTNTANKGTGNYGNHPLYIGRRGGTLLPFNGHIYSLIGIGRLTTDAETIALEKSIAKNTGVTLS